MAITTNNQPLQLALGGGAAKQSYDHEFATIAALIASGKAVLRAAYDPKTALLRELLEWFSSPEGFDDHRRPSLDAPLSGGSYPGDFGPPDGSGYRLPLDIHEAFRNVAVYSSFEEMIEGEEARTGEPRGGLDAAFTVVPHDLHERTAVDVLEAGLHCRSQKPMATSLEGCRRMLEAEERSGKLLGVCLQYADAVSWVAKQIEEGKIGTPDGAHLGWRRENGIPGSPHFWELGVLGDLPEHLLAALMRLTSSEPTWVEVTRATRRWGNELYGERFTGFDTVQGDIGFDDGMIAGFDLTWKDRRKPDEELGLSVSGPEGWVKSPLLAKVTHAGALRQSLHLHEGGGQTIQGPSTGTFAQVYVAGAEAFVDAVASGTRLSFTARDAYNVARVGIAMLDSANSGGRVPVPEG